MSSSEQQKSRYWESYYAASRPTASLLPPPSQFAAFVAQEVGDDALVVDVGCGSGRDSMFFAQRGLQVIGVDESSAAVDACQKVAADAGVDHAHFFTASVATDDFGRILGNALKDRTGQVLVYARFFIHAITEEEQSAFLQTAAEMLRRGDRLAVEYRTTRDRDLSKVTAVHYRRFQDSSVFSATVARVGFDIDYTIEGYGFAKFRHDDAHVARGLYTKA